MSGDAEARVAVVEGQVRAQRHGLQQLLGEPGAARVSATAIVRSEECGALFAAIAKAQGAFRKAAKGSVNPHLRNRYADLEAVIDAVQAALSAEGVGWLQPAELEADEHGARVAVTTILGHESGQWLQSTLRMRVQPIKGLNLPQAVGSVISYARRYALSSMLGVATGDDTDGAQPQQTTQRNR